MNFKIPFKIFILILSLFHSALEVSSQTHIEINQHLDPPRWALLQQQVQDKNLKFMELVFDKYINPTSGHLECIERWGGSDGPDDAMENFYNWPLVYALGGSPKTLELFKFIWNGHIEQYTNSPIRDPRGSTAFYKEFISAFDWEHTGEGIAPFLLLPLADPYDSDTQRRVLQFANLYTGRDPEPQNYDTENKIIQSVFNGSRGPWLSTTPEQILLNSNSWRTRGAKGVMGDVPLNLISTSLALNAYMLSTDSHYKDWILEYTSAWLDRTIQNNWMIPSNIGLNGRVGEHWEDKWYGGIMGWDWNFGGFRILGRGMRIGFGNAYFLSKNKLFLKALREQGDILFNNQVTINDLKYYLNNYGDEKWYNPLYGPVEELTSWYGRERSNDGWYYPRPLNDLSNHYADLYMWSFKQEDLGRTAATLEGELGPWFKFLNGQNVDYPEESLEKELHQLDSLTNIVNLDRSTPATRRADHGTWPAATSTLINQMLGGLQPTKSGGLLYCQLRYFDPTNLRPGLPQEVGVLITEIDSVKVAVTLININSSEAKNIVIQTGAYGEHVCSKITIDNRDYVINNNYFKVHLLPGAGAEMTVYLIRNSHQPTLLFPWDPKHSHVNGIRSHFVNSMDKVLVQSFPNPFNSQITISYYLPQAGKVRINIYNLQGQRVRTLVNVHQPANAHKINWDARDDLGQRLAGGVYIYQLEVITAKNTYIESKKITLTK